MEIDINCDMGESFGRYTLGNDEAVMPYISSANIACGSHASDPIVMQRTILLAKQAHVAVGAHPGYPDLQGFGRREIKMLPDEIEAFILYQIGALAGIATANDVEIIHVKPHGTLYNRAAVDHETALAIARAVARFSKSLILVGLAGSKLIEAGQGMGLTTLNEGFPDRGYNDDGTLMSRSLPGALLSEPSAVAQNAVSLAKNGIKTKIDGKAQSIQIQTLCIHGDNPSAPEIVKTVRQSLELAGVTVTRPRKE